MYRTLFAFLPIFATFTWLEYDALKADAQQRARHPRIQAVDSEFPGARHGLAHPSHTLHDSPEVRAKQRDPGVDNGHFQGGAPREVNVRNDQLQDWWHPARK